MHLQDTVDTAHTHETIYCTVHTNTHCLSSTHTHLCSQDPIVFVILPSPRSGVNNGFWLLTHGAVSLCPPPPSDKAAPASPDVAGALNSTTNWKLDHAASNFCERERERGGLYWFQLRGGGEEAKRAAADF